MARSSVWIAVVSILATFNIDKAVDEAGHVIEPTFEYLTALVRYDYIYVVPTNGSYAWLRSAPLPFKCSITPRSNEAAKLIRGIVH
jgi:hypothetical protein